MDVRRRFVRDETVDLVYIDSPFNSKRNYNQIYNNIGGEDGKRLNLPLLTEVSRRAQRSKADDAQIG